MTIEEYNAHIFAQIFGQSEARQAIARRNMQQPSVAVPVAHEANPDECKAIRFSVEVVK